jgi:NAD-dependent deacetylase
MISEAIRITETAEIFCVIGTSLAVYPAASLLHYVKNTAKVYLIDPNPPSNLDSKITIINKKASLGVADFVNII